MTSLKLEWKKFNVRNAFVQHLMTLSNNYQKIVLLTADLGFGALEPFEEKFPHRFFNVGIAEQNMIGVAAGLSSAGKLPFIYSIGNFPTFRCAEHIRNEIDYHNLPAVIVSVGAGVSYGSLGYSHHAIQDIALMRSFPNMLLLTPCDANQVKACLDYLIENPSPAYLRLGKVGEAVLSTYKKLIPGHCSFISYSKKNKLLLCLGNAAQYLKNFSATEYDIANVPIWGQKIDFEPIENIISKYEEIVVYEHHLKSGGFYSWVCENIKDRSILLRLKSLCFDRSIVGSVGQADYLIQNFLKWT